MLDTILLYSEKSPLLTILNYDFISLKGEKVSFKLNPVIRSLFSVDLGDPQYYNQQKIGFSKKVQEPDKSKRREPWKSKN